MLSKIIIMFTCSIPLFAGAQLVVQRNAGLFLGNNSEMVVQGEMDADDNVSGNGTLILSGASTQTLKTNKILNLIIDNASGVMLGGPLYIDGSLQMRSGKLTCGVNNLLFGSKATITGNSSSYINAESAGKVIKFIDKNLNNYMLPVGTSTSFTPVFLTSSGPYSNASIAVSTHSSASPNKPAGSTDYIDNYWSVSRKGTSASIRVAARYHDVKGEEESIVSHYWDGARWQPQQRPNRNQRLISMDVPTGDGQIFAMRPGADEYRKKSVSLYPNPVTNTATIDIFSYSDDEATIIINGARGTSFLTKRVKLNKGNNQVQLNTSSLNAGTYGVTIFNGMRHHTIKFVKAAANK